MSSLASDPGAWTLREAAGAIRDRAISSSELTHVTLQRIARRQPEINAFIALDAEGALRGAAEADALAASGVVLGPLHGVPLAHKDMLDRPGRVTGCGSKVRGAAVAATKATVLARLDAAGALDLGRLNMSEFALGPTGLNAHHGRAKNPHDPARITGGSSSGSGAAVGSGMVYGAIGSDTGGSIRLPAAMCGVAGLKPTQGRVSRYGAMPLSFSQDCLGPLAPTVGDVALLFEIIAGPDGLDPTVAAVPVKKAAPRADLRGLKVGLSQTWLQGLDSATAKAHADLRETLKALGAEIVEVAMPDPLELGELSNILAMTEAAAIHGDTLKAQPQDYGAQVRARLRQGAAMPGALYLRAVAMRAQLLEEAIAGFGAADIVCLPVLPFLPPLSADVDGDAATGGAAGASAIPQMVGQIARFTRSISYLGLPSLAQPIAFAEGLPIGMQTVGRPFVEAQILSAGMAVESALGFASRRLP